MMASYTKVSELAILAKLSTTNKIHCMATEFCTTEAEVVKAQWELNLQIVEVRMKAQPATPLEILKQCCCEIQAGLEMIKCTIWDCSGLLDQPLLTLTAL